MFAKPATSSLVAASNCGLYPLDEQVAMLILTRLNMHDAIIVATALVYRDILHESVAVITKNGEITHSCLIETVWEKLEKSRIISVEDPCLGYRYLVETHLTV